MNKPELNALWIGGSLSYIEQLCLVSAMDAGHSVNLYTYYGVTSVPPEVDIRDAREIMPESVILNYNSTRQYALCSDLFRYFLLQKTRGCYIDCDLFFLKRIPQSNYIFGFEDDQLINGAILRLPSNSIVLEELIKFANSSTIIPPWWNTKKKIKQWLRGILYHPKSSEHLGWGIIGPKAITYFVKKNNIAKYAYHSSVFYPIHWRDAEKFFDPYIDIFSMLSSSSIAVHLWNEKIKEKKNSPPPDGSFIAIQCKKFNIKTEIDPETIGVSVRHEKQAD